MNPGFRLILLNPFDGLTVENEKAFPAFSLELKDRKGNTILSNPNVLSAYEDTGANVNYNLTNLHTSAVRCLSALGRR